MDLAHRIVEEAEALQRNALLEQACTVRVSIGEEAQYNVSVVPMGQLVQLEYEALVWKVPRNESKAFEDVWGFIGEAMLEHARAFNAEQARRKQQAQVPAGSVAHSVPRQEPAPADSEEQHPGQAADGDGGDNGGNDSDSANDASGDADTSDSDGDFELSFLLEDDDVDDYASHHSLAEIWPQRFTIELIKRGKTLRETSAFSMDLSEHLIQQTKMLRYLY